MSLICASTAMHEAQEFLTRPVTAARTCGLAPISGQVLKREEWRAHAGLQGGELGRLAPFALPWERQLSQVPRSSGSPARPGPPIPGPPESPRSRLPIRLRSTSQQRAGQPVGRLRRGRAQEWSPAGPRPGSEGARSPPGRHRPSSALPGREGGEGRGRGSLQAAPPSAERAPVAGEKSEPSPARSPRAQRPLLVSP